PRRPWWALPEPAPAGHGGRAELLPTAAVPAGPPTRYRARRGCAAAIPRPPRLASRSAAGATRRGRRCTRAPRSSSSRSDEAVEPAGAFAAAPGSREVVGRVVDGGHGDAERDELASGEELIGGEHGRGGAPAEQGRPLQDAAIHLTHATTAYGGSRLLP
ncbi:unnamed protein product, partial [Urochloa humidicola]